MIFGLIAAGLSFVTAGIGLFGASKVKSANKKAAREAYAIDQENRKREQAEIQESIRRTGRLQQENLGTAVSRAGGTGILRSGSLNRYLIGINKQQETELAWMKTSGASLDAIKGREAEARKRISDRAASANFISAVGRSIGQIAGGFGALK